MPYHLAKPLWKAQAESNCSHRFCRPICSPEHTPMVRVTGFEPTTPCAQNKCSTKLSYTRIMELAIRFELTTTRLQIESATIAPRQHMAPRTGLEPVTFWLTVRRSTYWAIAESGEQGRSWTYDVSYVADLQSVAFATRHTCPLLIYWQNLVGYISLTFCATWRHLSCRTRSVRDLNSRTMVSRLTS